MSEQTATVLVSDDDPIVRARVREALEESEFQVVGEAESAPSAQLGSRLQRS